MIVSEISTQVRERIPVSEIHGEDYVSTDNMRPNFCGIKPSLSVPPTGTVTAYKGLPQILQGRKNAERRR